MSNYIQLTSGGGYDFDDKKIFGRYDMERDVAHSLAHINRYAGHSVYPWPVAIHSVCVGKLLLKLTGNKDLAAAGLGHDAHESVIGDIPTPVAYHIGYAAVAKLKHEVQEAIEDELKIPFIKSSLNPGWQEKIKCADAAALLVEKQLFMVPENREWAVKSPGPEWTQPMYDIMMDAMKHKDNADGGLYEFISCYREWIGS